MSSYLCGSTLRRRRRIRCCMQASSWPRLGPAWCCITSRRPSGGALLQRLAGPPQQHLPGVLVEPVAPADLRAHSGIDRRAAGVLVPGFHGRPQLAQALEEVPADRVASARRPGPRTAAAGVLVVAQAGTEVLDAQGELLEAAVEGF